MADLRLKMLISQKVSDDFRTRIAPVVLFLAGARFPSTITITKYYISSNQLTL